MEAWNLWAIHAHKRMINKDEDDDEEGGSHEYIFLISFCTYAFLAGPY
jgi:hypothetical protein